MPVETSSGQPAQFTAGDTVRFTVSNASFPATGWSLTTTFRNGTTILSAEAEDDGTGFIVTLTATETAALIPGHYSAANVFTETASGEKATVQAGIVRVLPDLTSTTVGPRRAAYNRARAALDSLAMEDTVSVNFSGQSYTLQSIDQLQKLVDRMEIDANEEDRTRGIGNRGGLVRIQTRLP